MGQDQSQLMCCSSDEPQKIFLVSKRAKDVGKQPIHIHSVAEARIYVYQGRLLREQDTCKFLGLVLYVLPCLMASRRYPYFSPIVRLHRLSEFLQVLQVRSWRGGACQVRANTLVVTYADVC